MQSLDKRALFFFSVHYMGFTSNNSSFNIIRRFTDITARRRPEDEPHQVDAERFHGADVFGLAHPAHFDNHSFAMNSPRAAPGSGSFMNRSPIRNPRKPHCRSCARVSGRPMPLSLTFTASTGSWPASRKLFSTSVTKVPRLRLLIPHMSGSRPAYSSSCSACISSRTSRPRAWAAPSSCRHSSRLNSAAMSRTAEAPHRRAMYSWYSSTTNSLQRMGRVTPLSRAFVMKSGLPPKYLPSARMLSAAAPFRW